MASNNPALAELNFVLIPLLSASRIIPMVDIAKFLARRVIDRAMGYGLLIRVLELQFPDKEAGLPEGCESLNLLPSMAFVRNFYNATDMLQNEAENLLEEMKPKPSCIISDTLIAWTADTSDKFQIPRILFDGISCFSEVCLHNLYIMKDQNKIPDSGSFVIPDLPDRIEVTKAQLPAAFHPGTISIQDIRDKIRAAETRSYGVVINTFEELEQSLGRITVVQFVELALVLEASGYPFILVIKEGEGQELIEDWILENGFEKRTKERGLLIRGWAAQEVIHFGEEGKFEAQVSKEEIIKAIKIVKDKEEEGKESRKRARELGEMAKRAVESAGSSYLNITEDSSSGGYGQISKPLTDLLKRDSFKCARKATATFQSLKNTLTTASVLALPDFSLIFTVETDACDVGIGVVIMKKCHPIAYLSKGLSQQHQVMSESC
uniref:UDP-glycosyltransferase 73E1-like n=1 Tax=Nicotiana tabacum TaxID=4097 RepID=A0A1S3ZRL3_TOBAC|nr:PREDICTED: UDP-glycosyltransferase 73E1-like [Nicotiana tabacum]